MLAILTADCLPVVFAANDGSEVAAAHAGWRGLAAGVLEATVRAMRTPPERIIAWLGPAAGPQAYEVGREVFDAFVSADAGAAAAFTATRRGHWRVDLYALARMRLAAVGVTRSKAATAARSPSRGMFFRTGATSAPGEWRRSSIGRSRPRSSCLAEGHLPALDVHVDDIAAGECAGQDP